MSLDLGTGLTCARAPASRQMELIEMQSDKDEAEKTRDVALTALFAGVEKSLTVGKGLQEIRDSTFGKLGFENRHVRPARCSAGVRRGRPPPLVRRRLTHGGRCSFACRRLSRSSAAWRQT
mmetsp:Transcript_46003/g.116405  ORF Transcript_46003/g.116405 Transcript_46003/m.116405 type:complete len:121 (-) Transcript_46003:738-1100(-)